MKAKYEGYFKLKPFSTKFNPKYKKKKKLNRFCISDYTIKLKTSLKLIVKM